MQEPSTNREVSLVSLGTNGKTLFKVTRRIPEYSISDTKFFKTKEEALVQFEYWLD